MMSTTPSPKTPTTPILPLLEMLEALDGWQGDPSTERRHAVAAALERLLAAYGSGGGHLDVRATPLPSLDVGVGSLLQPPQSIAGAPTVSRHELRIADGSRTLGTLWLDESGGTFARLAARAVEVVLDAAWSRAEARAATQRLAALDAAVRGIAGVLSVDRVLQLIVDRVRELSDAQYAALGTVDSEGMIERFITSGITAGQRQRIGPLPRGHGLLGLIIRENRAIRIEDIALDPRRYNFPPHHPEMHSFLGVPVRSKGRTVGNLYLTNKQHGPTFSEEDERLVEMFGLHAGIAIENARLHEEVRRLAVVEDRDRISQDLHDGIIQSLYGVALALEDVPEIMADDPDDAARRLDRSIDSIHQTIRDIRNFILGLQPELLDEADVADGIRALGTEFEANTMVDLELRIDDPLPNVDDATSAQLLAMSREALSNIARHASASRASIELRADDGTLVLVITDNGRGFDPAHARAGGHGLRNLQSRAEALGGSLVVHSRPGAGTTLEARIPVGEGFAPATQTETPADD